MSKIQINLTNYGQQGVVTIDGVPVPAVRSVTFHSSVDEVAVVTLQLIGQEVEIES